MTKPSYPKTNQEKAKLYLHTMVEVKERLHVIRTILALPIAPLFVQELSYLQLRYICELIAIACLAAQGDYETQKAFTESYRPPEIFKKLRELYPNFFPECAERIITFEDGRRHHHVKRGHKPDAYVESDVTKLWQISGDHLHRASVSKYLRTTFTNQAPDLTGIKAHLHGLVHLLQTHLIPIQKNPDEDVLLLIEMGSHDQPARMLFVHLNKEDSTTVIEEYTAALQR